MFNKSNQSKLKSLRIGLASPEQIRKWSKGEVKKPETINYKTLKPEPEGLFAEEIFGPIKSYECACGKYKKVKYRGKVCEKCGVEVTENVVRRERMGHIELASPVTHIWMTKELPSPSKISLCLDMPYKQVEEVVNFTNYIVLESNNSKIFKTKDIIDLNATKLYEINRKKLRTALKDILDKLPESSLDYRRAQEYYERIRNSSLPFSQEDVFRFIKKYTGVEFGIGAEAIQYLLKKLDLNAEKEEIRRKLSLETPGSIAFKKLTKRYECILWFIQSGVKPEWMVLNVIPVTPPDTRPIVHLHGGKTTTSDINNFYRKIIIRNERLKKLIEIKAPTIILNNEKRMLQEAVDSLFDNSSRSKQSMSKDKRPLKSLTDHLKGKEGLFRKNLLGKRVDYSGRSVIVGAPELKMYQAGIPSTIILTIFKPFIIHELINKFDESGNEINPIAANSKLAEKMILRQEPEIWPIVTKVMRERPVLLNRAPTLHRLGVQAFEPILTDGKAIRLHPLVCAAFNADFDGDQMGIHLPISPEAVAEARDLMLASWHILGPKDGKPVVAPTQDIVLGIYYVTSERKGLKGEGTIFSSANEVRTALMNNAVEYNTVVGISSDYFVSLGKKNIPANSILITTPGKVIFNETLPNDFDYINNAKNLSLNGDDIVSKGESPAKAIEKYVPHAAVTKSNLSNIVQKLNDKYETEQVAEYMDNIKNTGFKMCTKSGITMSIFDLPEYTGKEKFISAGEEEIVDYKNDFDLGLSNDNERYIKVIQIWEDKASKIRSDFKAIMNDTEKNGQNSTIIMANSGSRGNVAQFSQLLGMRGLMNKSSAYDQIGTKGDAKRKAGEKLGKAMNDDTIETPIKHSLVEGLTSTEYFNSCYGTRKAMADTAMKTSKSGYLTRKLVDSAQDIIVTTDDCGTTKGLLVKAIFNSDGVQIESLEERIKDRFSNQDIIDPKTGAVIVPIGELISPEQAKLIAASGIEEVEIRSVIHCNCEHGVCQKCFGKDLTTKKVVEIGTPIGVIAAQSIGEPATQLNMKSKQTGGSKGAGGNVAEGFKRLQQILDATPPKEYQLGTASHVKGVVEKIVNDGQTLVICVKNNTTGEEEKIEVKNSSSRDSLRIKEGMQVSYGDLITKNSSLDIKELLTFSGIEKCRHYIINEAQSVYRQQGIETSDKYLEIIVRQMTNKVKILNAGDSDLFVGKVIELSEFTKLNTDLLLKNKTPITALSLVLGLDSIPAHGKSFLSAASFQDSKKILTDAAVKRQTDFLFGLKENVMLGGLIPAGTAYKTSEEIIENGDKMYRKEY